MGIRSWLGNKLFNIDKVVDNKVRERLSMHDSAIDLETMKYREKEYKVWANANPNKLLEFYSQNYSREMYDNRFTFWQWVGTADVPKLHYPAPEGVMNHMKSLLFGSEINIEFTTNGNNLKEVKKLNERLHSILEYNNFYELLQTASMLETYSGTIGFKINVDPEFSNKPIIQVYPKERLELLTKYGKVGEIVFKDYYKRDRKVYTLRSYYGYGYIDYKLYDDREKEVPLSTIPELANLEKITFNKKIMMAVYKKNRTTSNEFIDSPYGGSDFEGVIDLFHAIDETFSTMMLYIRRSRPIITIPEQLLPHSPDGSRNIIPKEYYFDTILTKPSDIGNDSEGLKRDFPRLDVSPYITSILELLKSVYQKIGLSYTTAGLEAHSANISGAALIQKEKNTIIVRSNKIKLWEHLLNDLMRLLLVYDDIINDKTIKTDYSEYELLIEFPDFNETTFEDKVDLAIKGLQGGVMDYEEAVNYVFDTRYEEERIKEIIKNIKIENGVPLFKEQMSDE